MSTSILSASPVAVARHVPKPDTRHRRMLALGYTAILSVIVAVFWYGFDYYTLPASQRPFSPKHVLLKPSGPIGIKLGILGVIFFLTIFLYPIRKRWSWLGRQGTTRHWLDFHIMFGLSAPFIIALHSSFKFQGFAGMAFWIMVAVAASGVVGRYLYGQIPRRVNAAEISLKELHESQQKLADELASQKLISRRALDPLFRGPTAQQAARIPGPVALVYMMLLDLARPFHVARLRMRVLGLGKIVTTGFGFFSSGNREIERVIELAKERSSLSKKIVFLSHAQQVFHLWHVVHKPFSYTFAVLALFHIVVVFMLGFM